MILMDFEEYREDVDLIANLELPWERLENRGLLLSGGTGLIGSFLIDVIMYRNKQYGMNCHVYALGRSAEKAQKRFLGKYQKQQFIKVPRCPAM